MSDERYERARMLRYAAIGVLHYLTHGDPSTELATRETEFHHGDDPIRADDEAQNHFVLAARDHPGYGAFGIIAIVGEENIEDIPPHGPGARVVVLDPLDGSRPWAIGRIGYCVAALLLRALDEHRWEVESALIATPTDAFTLLDPGQLLHGPLHGQPETDLVIGSVVPESEVFGRSIAAVAYKPEDRNDALPIVAELPQWSFITLGGNPLTPYVLTGRLTAVITLKETSTWDSVGVLMAAATDAVIGDHDGDRYSGPDLRKLFAQILLTGNVKAIPKLIVAKSEAAYREIVAAISRSRETPRTDG